MWAPQDARAEGRVIGCYCCCNAYVHRVWWRRLLWWRRPVLAETESFKIDDYPSSPHFPEAHAFGSGFGGGVSVSIDNNDGVGISDGVGIGSGVINCVGGDDIDDISEKIADEDSYGVETKSPSSKRWTKYRKWPTPWYWQLLVLTVRAFRQSRYIILSKLNWVQTLLLAIVVSLVWFQIPKDEESISDRLGFVRSALSGAVV